MTEPGRLPGHRELHPVFFGCFDWHSCVEMWWAAIRLMRRIPNLDNETHVRLPMETLLTGPAVDVERAVFDAPDHSGFECPYGWGWLLTLQHELEGWNDPDGQRWEAALSLPRRADDERDDSGSMEEHWRAAYATLMLTA